MAYHPLLVPHLTEGLAALGSERILVSRDGVVGTVTGFAIFGIVPGTEGAGRVRAIAVGPQARRRGLGRMLMNSALETLRNRNARFVLVELPDDPLLRRFESLLSSSGFVEETRAADLVRDGVAMRYLRRYFDD
ncbi:MAG: hypothetical protein MNPFHGCM_01889 [Gemmatimonadaceae bacterium]|nr:hypothetical protein [Gemmatimonadaceae bacterium]